MTRPEFLGQLVLAQRRRGLRIDAFEQARQHLFLDLVDARLEPLRPFGLHILGRRALVQPLHRLQLGAEGRGRRIVRGGRGLDGRELASTGHAGPSLHRLRHAKGGAASGSGTTSECTHRFILLLVRGECGFRQQTPHQAG